MARERERRKKWLGLFLLPSVSLSLSLVVSPYMTAFFSHSVMKKKKKKKTSNTRDTNREKVHKCVEQDIINEFFLFDLTTVFHNTHIYSFS